MVSSTPVPTKNALRALRHLAFSTPTLVAGAVGSACCVAALSCEARSRVRLAEKIVATKRTLRSVSNGQGNARLARMFEAAERGEDFLLDPRFAHRRRRVRHYMAKAAPVEEDDETIPALQANLAATPARAQAAGRKRTKFSLPNGAEDTTMRSVGSGLVPMLTRSSNSPNPDALRQSSDSAHGAPFDSHRTNRSSNLYKDVASRGVCMDLDHTRTSTQSILSSLRSKSPAVPNSNAAERIRKASMATHKSATHAVHHAPPKLPSERLIGETTKMAPDSMTYERNANSNGSSAESQQRDSAHDLVNDHLFSADDFVDIGSAQEGPHSVEIFENENETLADENGPSPDFSDAGLIFSQAYYDGFLDPAPDHDNETERIWHRRLSAQLTVTDPYDMSLEKEPSTDLNEMVDADDLCEAKMLAMADQPTPSDYRSLTSWNADLNDTVSAFLASDEVSGLENAENVFHKLYDRKKHGLLPLAALLLLHRLLVDEATRPRALRILASAQDSGTEIDRERVCEMRIMHYMKKFCTSGTRPATWTSEFWKIAGIVSNARMGLTARIAETFLRALCWADEPSKAESVYQKLQKSFDLGPSLHVERVLAVGYAMKHDWSSVNRIMAKLQELQVPRTRPTFYSLTFAQLFRIHFRDHNFDASYDYLINAMGYWKLTPSNHISRVLIAACIKARRFLTLQEWIETTRQMWPRLEAGIATRRYAFEVGRAWTEIQATCKDIEDTCRAMAYGTLTDPFASNFRSVLRDTLATALKRQYMTTLEVLGHNSVMPTSERDPLHETLHQAHELIESFSRRPGLSQEEQEALAALEGEISALKEVDKILSGSANQWKVRDRQFSIISEPLQIATDVHHLHGTSIPSALDGADLPPLRETWALTADLYVRHRQAGGPPPHYVLTPIAKKLAMQGRHHEAVRLLRAVHSSPFVKGKDGSYFDGKLYGLWLEMCERTGSPMESRFAMWALIDACRVIKLTAEHMVIVGLCTAQHGDIELSFGSQSNHLEEAEYLQRRLRKQRWIQLGASGSPPFMSEWKTWQEQIRA